MKYDHYIGRGFSRWSEGEYTPGQVSAMKDRTSSFILLSGAYRSGKSEAMCRIGLIHGLTFPNAKVGVFRAHLASLKKSTLITFLELTHPKWVDSFSNTELKLRLINGTEISFIGADFSERLGSIELTLALVDEGSEVTKESLDMIIGRLSGQLVKPPNYDSLPDNKKDYIDKSLEIRQCFISCNPKGKNHYLYKRFIESPQPGHSFYTSNSISNTNLPEIYLVNNLSAYVRPGYSREWIKQQIKLIRSGEKDPDGLFLQGALTPFGQRNLLGLWVATEGAIYDLDEDIQCLDSPPNEWQSNNAFYAAVDFGFHDPRIIVAESFEVSVEGSSIESYFIREYFAGSKLTDSELIEKLSELDKKYNIRKIYLPPDRANAVKIAKKKLGGAKIKKAKNSVKAGIMTTSRMLSQNRIIFNKDHKGYDKFWQEMTGYTWRKNKDGDFLEEPVKADDHYPDALRYLIFSRHEKDTNLDADALNAEEIITNKTITHSPYD